ncbi:hypothetical protein B0H13DRAFT_1850362 [Mycena leptocephala]|nr:hypothetical protein B0H13DRAFT_1850362 [Mycena leptocephala]
MVTALIGGQQPPAAAPSTPKATHINESPAVPSPTKLPRFLEHAEKNLGVSNARSFEPLMRQNGYGPDIMHLLDNQALLDCGMNMGDALRMKAGSVDWWKGPDAKRKRADSEVGPIHASITTASGSTVVSTRSAQNDPGTPPSKKISFERRYDEEGGGGGASRFFGPRITPVKGSQSVADKNIWLLAAGSWIPMPLGYRPVQDYEFEEEEDDKEDGTGDGMGDGMGNGGSENMADNEAAEVLFALRRAD